MNRDCFIDCYYVMLSQSIYLELFEQVGISNKLVHAAKSVIPVPIYSCSGKYFVLSYSTSDGGETLISPYDSELNLIKSVT